MGVATLLVIFGHSAGNGVIMPKWLESLCGLASVGVDIFLFVSGLGLWYSLKKLNDKSLLRWGGIKQWYIRRYKRILIPYLIIIGFHQILSIIHGKPVFSALMELSTIEYWLNHRGAWFIAMLIPVYAITPLHYIICKRMKKPVLYSVAIVAVVVVISSLNYPIDNTEGQMIISNIKHVMYHIPSFLIGFMLAPFAIDNRKISIFWMVLLPASIVIIMRFMHWGYWPEFIVLPFIVVLCLLFQFMHGPMSSVLEFFGKISLESYLFNTVIGSWLIWYLPNLYESPLNYGCYLSYFLICVIGTVLAYFVNRFCNKILNHPVKQTI